MFARLKIPIRGASFSRQLAIAMGVGIVLTSLISSFVISTLSSRAIRDRLILEGYQAAETLAAQSTLALLYQSGENAQDFAQAMLTYPDVEGIEIFDLDHKPLLSLGKVSPIRTRAPIPEQTELASETSDTWLFAAPVRTGPISREPTESPFVLENAEPEVLGYVQITMGKRALHTMASHILKTNFLVSSTLAVTLLALLLLITRRVTGPINRLAQTMHRAEMGEKLVRAKIEGPRDITRMQNAFNKMMEVLDAREAELEKARDTALESARIKGEFAASVSHELRTPLNGVLGMLELLQDMGLSSKQAEYVQIARSSGETLLALINDILDFSRNDAGKLTAHEDDFDLYQILDEVVSLVGSQVRRKRVDLGVIAADDIPAVLHGDPNRLRQILINLVGNAVKFTERGEIAIAVSRDAAVATDDRIWLRFEVQDTGIGIAADSLEYIFEPFRQVDGSPSRKYKGTGLGLAICRQLVEFLGGQISVTSTPGRGSTFWFTLPFAVTVGQHSAAETGSELAGLRVLVVDPSASVRRHTEQICRSWGMSCQGAGSRQEGLDLLHRLRDAGGHRYDLIIADETTFAKDPAGRPRATTREVLEEGTKLVLMTQDGNHYRRRHQAAIHGYIEKPIQKKLLYKCLTDVLTFGSDQSAERPAAPRAAAAQEARVLVVEDNRSNQIVAAGMLERLGFAVTLAGSGQEALEALRHMAFDLIFMDCNMPEMDGYETTRRIRSVESGPRIPVIAMTANAQEGDRIKCVAAGMDDYLPKPLKLGALRAKLEQWLPQSVRTATGGQDRAITGASAAPATGDDSGKTLNREFIDELRETIGDAFPRMLAVFLEDIPGYVEELGQAISRGHMESIANAAHAIKSSSVNIGAGKIAGLCKDLEAAAQGGKLTEAQGLFAAIVAEAGVLRTALKKELSPDRETATADTTRSSYILVVDDDRSTRFILRNVLEEEGYSVIEADDGEKAIELCKYRTPDLVLMDAKMPVCDGFTACEKVRQQPESSQIPILIITGLEDEFSIERAFSVGATDYIPKPINFSVLRKRISHLMHASHTARHVRRLTHYDALTGLPNRTRFTDHLNELIVNNRDKGRPLAVMFIDIDRFKLINDTLGHEAGDMLIKIVADRISSRVREEDMVARLGGDEFTVVLDGLDSREVLSGIAAKICDAFNKPVVFVDQEIFVTVSIGLSVYPVDGEDIAALMKHADTAMFHAKKYRNDFKFYEDGMEAAVSKRLELENDLRRALERDELVVYYQPKAELYTGRIVGVEALVRWQHPQRGMIPPMDFIPLAEETGLISVIGEWVLRESCRQLCAWLQAGYGPLRVAVNLSGRQLERRLLIEEVEAILKETGLPAHCLELEITESVVMENAEEIIPVFQRFKDMNISLAIDDFGTGYSSLSHLKRFPIDILKIDRTFVRDLPHDTEDVAIVVGVIAMAKGLGLEVVAEGVENVEQQAFLRDQHCDYMQGYHLSKPLPAEEFEQRFLKSKPAGEDAAGNGNTKITVLKPKNGKP